MLWISALLTFTLLFFACRRSGPLARGSFQNFFEAIIEFVDKEVVQSGIGKGGESWAAFIISLFFFVLFTNLLGLIPGLSTKDGGATANINVTGGLAIIVFGVMMGASIYKKGLWGFLKSFMPPGVPWFFAPLLVPIEVVVWLFRPISLAIRLFANMVAGHLVIAMFLGMGVGAWKLIPWVGAVAMSAFEIFVCFVQAFIFAMLAGLYIHDAIEVEH